MRGTRGLLEALADCFVEAVSRFNHEDAQTLRYIWLGFLQDVPIVVEDKSFSFMTTHIFDRFRERAVLETQTQVGLFVKPIQAIYVPKSMRDFQGRFILANVVDLAGQHYLLQGYDSYDPDQRVLSLLGVQIIQFSQFFSILKGLMLKFMKVFTQPLPEFHSLLSQMLCNSPKDIELDTLPSIPLRDGLWVRQS